jgi:hypothetical protein
MWPTDRLVGIWKSLGGVKAVKSKKNHQAAAAHIWPRLQSLGKHADRKLQQQATPNAQRKAKRGAHTATSPAVKGKSNKKARNKKAPTGKKAGSRQDAAASREGSKTTQVRRGWRRAR